MRKIIASTFLSVDGFIVGPNEDMSWVMENFNDEMAHYAGDLMSSMDTVLLGRVTYEIMARAWPNMTEEYSPGADTMNAVPKVVVSSTLTAAPWGTYGNVRLVKDDLAQAITALKEQPGKNIVIYGSATLVRGLTRLGLIDEAGEAHLWRAVRAGHHRLGDILVRAGAIDHESLQKALAARNGTPSLLGDHLAGQGLITPADLAAALARQAEGAPRVLDTALALGLIAEGDAERARAEITV